MAATSVSAMETREARMQRNTLSRAPETQETTERGQQIDQHWSNVAHNVCQTKFCQFLGVLGEGRQAPPPPTTFEKKLLQELRSRALLWLRFGFMKKRKKKAPRVSRRALNRKKANLQTHTKLHSRCMPHEMCFKLVGVLAP